VCRLLARVLQDTAPERLTQGSAARALQDDPTWRQVLEPAPAEGI
jgi:hypothetical protein